MRISTFLVIPCLLLPIMMPVFCAAFHTSLETSLDIFHRKFKLHCVARETVASLPPRVGFYQLTRQDATPVLLTLLSQDYA